MATGATLGFCRACGRETPFHAFRLLDADTRERPRAVERRCSLCGLVVLTLGDLHDSVGLCEVVVSRWLRRQAVRADAPWLKMAREEGAPIAPNNRVDPDDARAHLFEQLWRLYRGWDPSKVAFTSYASQWLPRRLDDWIGNATGDATRGGKRRSVAKPAPTSLDALTERVETLDAGDATTTDLDQRRFDSTLPAATPDRHESSRLVDALGGREGDDADDRASDLRGLLSGRDRERVRREPDRRVQAPRRATG